MVEIAKGYSIFGGLMKNILKLDYGGCDYKRWWHEKWGRNLLQKIYII